MANFSQDVSDLDAAVKSNTAAITQLGAMIKQDTDTIASLNDQILSLKNANPAIDLSGLEADIKALEANNQQAAAIAPTPAPPPAA